MFFPQSNPKFTVGLRSVIAGALILLMANGCTQDVETSDATTLSSLTYAPAPGDDAPELAQLGKYRIGVMTKEFTYKDQDDIALRAFVVGDAPKTDRRISVDIIYPAALAEGVEPDAIYPGLYQTGLANIQGLPAEFEVKGMAVRDAKPVSGESFPLVIVSHGFFNTPGVLSGLTENLVTKGYVVAAIDHVDDDPDSASPIHTFATVLLNRSLDQQRILQEMLDIAKSDSALGQIINAESIGLVGFSMGGYGVLNHAGAGYNPEGESYGWVPGDVLQGQTENDSVFEAKNRDYIDAAITFAPWGGQPDAGMFTDKALSNIKTPLLVLGGSEDDIVNFDEGIQRIFNKTSGTQRYLLVFQNALHNIVQVPAPPSAHLDVVPWQTFEDPTWRRDKILSVGAHFMTAFFDWHLKDDTTKQSYFDVPTIAANDGTWEQPMFKDFSDVYADGQDASETYWKGFKRRQALGLELHKLEKGETR
jgi:predicted dienelactone hydrolase